MSLAGLPVIVLELALVILALVGFGWWQLRDLAKARRQAQGQRDGAGRNEGGRS
jgi:hypothetical protein